jgi:polysaccharide export outer membrane protein
MEQLHTARFSRFMLWSLLGLSVCALIAAGCVAIPSGRTVPIANATIPPSSADLDQITKINSALAAQALQNPASTADYRLAPEDLLEITLYNIPASEVGITPRTTEVRVTQEGVITLPLLGDVPAGGLTPSALEQSLRGRYDQYLHNPQIGVYVKEYRGQRVTVTGEVKTPGVIQLTGPKTLVDALSGAGGITDKAGSQVHLYRQGSEGRQSYIIDLKALARNPALVNMPVQTGDMINVPQSGMFFVDGAVRRPGSYPLTYSYTLTQALAVAGGADIVLANMDELSIFRRRDGEEADKIAVSLTEILAGKAKDPLIAPDDVIIVSMSTGKWLLQRFIGTIGLPSIPGQ